MSIQPNADRRVAVVTGGAGAIGGAIAARLAADHTVVVLDRHGDVPVDLGDTAAVVAILASDDAAAMTGQTLTVDGGLVLR